MKSKQIKIFISFIFALVFFMPLNVDAKKQVNIGIILDGPWSRFQEDVEAVRQEIIDLTEGEFEVAFPESMQIDGNWSTDEINRAIDSLLANKDSDLIIQDKVFAVIRF